MPLDFDLIRIILGLLSLIAFPFIAQKFYPGFLSKIWFILRAKYIKIPIRKSPMVQKIVNKELEDSKKQKYETFEAFLKDCPKYQIASGTLDVMIRNIYRKAGARFQQFVFIDKSAPEDKTAWLRREGHTVIHGKGTYALPFESEKEIIYFDINDMRPLIDKTNEMNWKNPDATADVITGLTNTNTMKGFRGEPSIKSSHYVIGLCIVILIAVAVDIYTADVTSKNTMDLLTQILNQTND